MRHRPGWAGHTAGSERNWEEAESDEDRDELRTTAQGSSTWPNGTDQGTFHWLQWWTLGVEAAGSGGARREGSKIARNLGAQFLNSGPHSATRDKIWATCAERCARSRPAESGRRKEGKVCGREGSAPAVIVPKEINTSRKKPIQRYEYFLSTAPAHRF